MIGIDEVGRGAWAGPLLVVAARQVDILPTGLKDSKVLSKKRREALRYDIQLSCDIGEGWVTSQEIDEFGLTAAMKLAVKRALGALDANHEEDIIMDGNFNYCEAKYLKSRCVIDADATHPIVSAASIFAKVLRDDFMTKLSQQLVSYGFESHVGYGTKKHIEALRVHGVTEHHRKSYAPVRKLLNDY